MRGSGHWSRSSGGVSDSLVAATSTAPSGQRGCSGTGSGVDAGQLLLVIVGVVSSVIAAFFYLRIIASMFVEDETAASLAIADPPRSDAAMLGIGLAAVAVVVLGVLPGALVSLAQQAGTFAG